MKPLFFLVLSPILLCSCGSEKQKSETAKVHKEETTRAPKITTHQSKVALVPMESLGRVAAPRPSPPRAIVISPPGKDYKAATISKIKFSEGFSNVTYVCPAGEKTIGYGFVGKYTARKWISQPEADKILEKELLKSQVLVKKIVKVKLSSSQLWALTSFTYNCGEGSLHQLVDGKGRLNAGNYASIPKLLPLYCKGNKKTLKGLVIRRAWELQIWQGKI